MLGAVSCFPPSLPVGSACHNAFCTQVDLKLSGFHDVIQDGVVLSCGGSAGPTCLALRQDDAQQKNNGTKGATWRGFGTGKNAFEGVPQWQHHSQLDYNRYYATGFEANCQPIKTYCGCDQGRAYLVAPLFLEAQPG